MLGATVNTFPDALMRKLEQLAAVGEAISTDQVRTVLGLTQQQYHRLTLQEDFPKRQHIGRKFWINPQRLLDFAINWNKMADGLTITQVATLIHSTIPTARRLAKRPDFPAPLGELNGRERWDREVIVVWHRTRLDGAKLGPDFDAGPDKSRKKKALTKGAHNGKKQTERRRATA